MFQYYKYVKNQIIKIVLVIICLFSISILGLLIPWLNKKAIDDGIIAKSDKTLLIICIILVFVIALKAFLMYLSNYALLNISREIIKNIHKKLIAKLLDMPLKRFTDKPIGYILTRVNELWDINNFFSPNTFMIIISIIEFVGAIIIMCKLSIYLTFIAIIPWLSS